MNPRLTAWRFLCDVLFAEEGTARPRLQQQTRTLQMWPRVIQFSDAHLVTPALWIALRRKGLIEHLPDEARQYVGSVYEMNVQRNRTLVAELNEAICLLNRRGIVPVLLKGASYLKANVFEDPAARILTDLDILIHEHEMPSAIETLHTAGYRQMNLPGFDFSRHHHWCPVARPGAYGRIEFHRHVVSANLAKIVPRDVLWKESIEKSEGGIRYRLLSPEHMVMVSFLHSQIIDGFGRTFTIGLRPILDLAALETIYNVHLNRLHHLLKEHGLDKAFRNYVLPASRAGVRTSFTVPFGFREWINYGVAYARIAWNRVERLSLHEFTAEWIRSRHGNEQNILSLNYYRLLFICAVIRRRFQMISISRWRRLVQPSSCD